MIYPCMGQVLQVAEIRTVNSLWKTFLHDLFTALLHNYCTNTETGIIKFGPFSEMGVTIFRYGPVGGDERFWYI